MKRFLSILMLCLVGLVYSSPQVEKPNDKYVIENSISQKNDIANLLCPSKTILFEANSNKLYDEILMEYRFTANVSYLATNKQNSSYYLIKGHKDKHSPHFSEKLIYLKEYTVRTNKTLKKKDHIDPGRNIFRGVNI